MGPFIGHCLSFRPFKYSGVYLCTLYYMGLDFYFSSKEIKKSDIHGLKVQYYQDVNVPQNDLWYQSNPNKNIIFFPGNQWVDDKYYVGKQRAKKSWDNLK